jgi:molecular chaperone DnaJ
MSEDFYDLLGVSKSATDAELKSAYKKAARKYHPDNGDTGNEELFKKVGEAYDVLKDPNKRAVYDRYGAEGLKGAGGGGAGFNGDFSGAGFEDLGDLFSSFFGGGFSGGAGTSGTRRNRPQKGQDHEVQVSIDFMDPKENVKKKIRINPLVTCKKCDGKGAEKAEDVSICPTCNGTGQVTTVQNTLFGQMRQSQTCPNCQGRGKIIKNPCSSCKGRGMKREEKDIEINIPAGIVDGTTMRLTGMGDTGRHGGPPGDIYLHVKIKKHNKFERDGADIYSTLKIGFAEAALGYEVKVPTIHGEHKVKIKPGTQSGEVHMIKDAGMPVLNRPRSKGVHHLTIEVMTPENLSGEEKRLLKSFQKSRQEKDILV